MLANDRDLDQVNVQLLDINDLFHHPDYQIRYADVRVKLMKYVGTIRESLPAIQLQINLFRQGEKLTKDPEVAKALHQAAEKLQLAYNKQFQLATDLTGVVQTMMSYQPPEDLNIQEAELAEQSQPKDMKDIKSLSAFRRPARRYQPIRKRRRRSNHRHRSKKLPATKIARYDKRGALHVAFGGVLAWVHERIGCGECAERVGRYPKLNVPLRREREDFRDLIGAFDFSEFHDRCRLRIAQIASACGKVASANRVAVCGHRSAVKNPVHVVAF